MKFKEYTAVAIATEIEANRSGVGIRWGRVYKVKKVIIKGEVKTSIYGDFGWGISLKYYDPKIAKQHLLITTLFDGKNSK